MDFAESSYFSSLVEKLMKQHHVPGLSVAVVHDDNIFAAGYGKPSLESPDTCTEHTLFDIASSAKILTATAVGLLVEDNENHPDLQWSTTMSSLLPEDFVLSDDRYTSLVTVEDILSHRSGMPAHNSSYMNPTASCPDDARSITRNLRNLPMAAPIRTKYLYNNMMYTVATHLVEVKSKSSFSDFLQKRLFEPLEMDSSSLQLDSAKSRGFGDRIAAGYHWNKPEGIYQGFQSPNCPEAQGAGSVITSAGDFIKFIKALLNREGPTTEALYQGLVRTRTFKNPDGRRLKPYTSPAAYAAGVDVYYYRGHMIVTHDGMISGFASRFFLLPEFKFGCVILGNSTGTSSIAGILMRELIDSLLQVSSKDQKPPKAAKKKVQKTKHDAPTVPQQLPHRQPQSKVEVKDANIESSTKQSQLDFTLYTGNYWNVGYHSLVVEIRNDQLFIDANDRSMAFTMTFEHIHGGTKFIGHLSDFWEGGDDPVEAEFILEDGEAIKLGLDLEPALRDKIWFEKIKEA